jgi:hypothetical protein
MPPSCRKCFCLSAPRILPRPAPKLMRMGGEVSRPLISSRQLPDDSRRRPRLRAPSHLPSAGLMRWLVGLGQQHKVIARNTVVPADHQHPPIVQRCRPASTAGLAHAHWNSPGARRGVILLAGRRRFPTGNQFVPGGKGDCMLTLAQTAGILHTAGQGPHSRSRIVEFCRGSGATVCASTDR